MKFEAIRLFAFLLFLSFGSVIHAAVQEYILGAGDIVRVSVYGQNDMLTVTRISEKGSLTFPLIGEVNVGGLPVSKAESEIANKLRKGGFVNKPQVNIIVEQYHSNQVLVLGQVNNPGKYVIERTSTVVELLGMAGGVSPDSADSIKVTKYLDGQVKRFDIDLIAIFEQGELSQNINVGNGDIVFVPRMNRFYIYGEVQRPGVYRLERNMTVMQALAVGGGLTPRGTEKGIMINRLRKDGRVFAKQVKMDEKLDANDVVYVKESLF